MLAVGYRSEFYENPSGDINFELRVLRLCAMQGSFEARTESYIVIRRRSTGKTNEAVYQELGAERQALPGGRLQVTQNPEEKLCPSKPISQKNAKEANSTAF